MVLLWYKLVDSNSNNIYVGVCTGLVLIMRWSTTRSSQKPLQQMSLIVGGKNVAVSLAYPKSKLEVPWTSPTVLDRAFVQDKASHHPSPHIHSPPAFFQPSGLWILGCRRCISKIHKICFPFSTLFISRWPQRRCENFCLPLALWIHALSKSQSTNNLCSM